MHLRLHGAGAGAAVVKTYDMRAHPQIASDEAPSPIFELSPSEGVDSCNAT